MMKARREKGVSIRVHPSFYERIEREREKFMKQNNLTRLTTVAFTKVYGGKNVKKKRRY